MQTTLHASAASDTARTIHMIAHCFRARADRTSLGTHSATDTPLRMKKQLGPTSLSFRIMAPQAAKRTALQINNRAQTGTVIESKMLDLKNFSGMRHPNTPSRRVRSERPA